MVILNHSYCLALLANHPRHWYCGSVFEKRRLLPAVRHEAGLGMDYAFIVSLFLVMQVRAGAVGVKPA